MHDPKVVAWEIVLPIPRRGYFHNDARKPDDYRWGTRRRTRTNPENLGEPVYPWYRLKAWKPFRIAGRALRLWPVGTIWHNEPGGKDALTVCRNRITNDDGEFVRFTTGWRWHIHHWSFQWFFEQRLRRFLFERCKECGRRYPWGYAPVSHSWGEPKSRWFKVEGRAYHHECSALRSLRASHDELEQLIRELVDVLSIAGRDEADVIDWLSGSNSPISEFRNQFRIARMFGYERDENYRLVKKL